MSYNAADIEVLSGLEPVRRRPGMYTDTSRPNHLAHEVIDNSVDEALAGHAKEINVTLHKDNSLSVADDGRGMPVDIHPKEKVSGVELILTRLHAGGKFNDKNYEVSGGLHGVGVSVVNALSKQLETWIKRNGKEYNISFKDGKVSSKLEVVGSVGQRNTGTTVRFWPDPKFFDSDKFSVPQLKHVLKAKAVLCPGLKITFENEATKEKDEWFFTGDLAAYLKDEIGKEDLLPVEPITAKNDNERVNAVDYALVWTPNADRAVGESYVNLIPTSEGGTHVNGLRAGVAGAVREFCEFRNLVPRGIKLTPEDIFLKACFVLSIKIQEPQFAGQIKERLATRDAAALTESFVHDSLSLWLNQHPDAGERIAQFAIENAQERTKAASQVKRKRVTAGPALPGKLADCTNQDPKHSELFLVEGDSAAARQDPEHLGSVGGRDQLLAGSARHFRGHGDRSGYQRPVEPAVSQDLHPGGCGLRRPAHRDLVVRAVPAALPPAGRQRSRVRRHAAVVSNRRRQERLLRARRCRTRLPAEEDRERWQDQGQAACAALQGPGRDEPVAAARDHDGSTHAPPGAAHHRSQGRQRQHHGHDAGQEARLRPARVVRGKRQSRRSHSLTSARRSSSTCKTN
jgi:DNA gyrase/topoisomerase IV subunit B